MYDSDEMCALVEAALDFDVAPGARTERFEAALGAYLGIPYVSFVNSGASANLLAFAALTQPELGHRAIQRGDEVVTVATVSPATLAPIMHYDAVPVFVDVAIPGYTADVSQLEAALSPKTKAVFLPHLLGNPFDVEAVGAFCDEHDLWLVEDNCDALGSTYTWNGNAQLTGTFGDIGTSSFSQNNHMSTGAGGAVYTRHPRLHKILRSLRDGGRDCRCPAGAKNSCGKRFSGVYGKLPEGYDHMGVCARLGFDLRASDLQAAVGCAQLQKFPQIAELCRFNWHLLHGALQSLAGSFVLPAPTEHADPVWTGYAITCPSEAELAAAVAGLEACGVRTHRLPAGNIVKHPCFDTMRGGGEYRVAGVLDNADALVERSFWVETGPSMEQQEIASIVDVLAEVAAPTAQTAAQAG